MREEKYQVILDENEHSIMLRCLNDKRTELIKQGKYTDAVDEVLVKVIRAKKKKLKVVYI